MHLRTKRLVLREFTWDDLDAVYAYESDPVVVAHVCYGPATKEQCRQDLTFHINHQTAQPRAFYHLALVLPPEEQPIGWCGLQIINPTRRESELGCALHRTHWGFGYATEATQAMLQFGFDHLGLHRIVGTCHPDNRRSIRVLEKAGMTYEGRLREHKWCRDHWRDTNLYSMLDHEWRSRRARSVSSDWRGER